MVGKTVRRQSSDPAATPQTSAPQQAAETVENLRRGRMARLRGLSPTRMHVRVHTLDSLRYRNFLLLWLSMTFTSSGFWTQQLVVGYFTFVRTGSPFLTSLALGLQMLPFIIAGPIGGVVADRFDKRKVLVIISVYQAAVTVAFAVLMMLDLVQTWHIFTFALVMGLAVGVADPTRVSLVPSLVGRSNLVNAFALNGLAFNGTRFAVPAVAGLLMVLIGPGATLLVGGLFYLGSTAAVVMLRLDNGHEAESKRTESNGGLSEAVRYVMKEPRILGVLALLGVPPFLLVPFVQGLMPVFASTIFGVDEWGLGLLVAAVGLGGTIGALFVASLQDVRQKGRALFAALGMGAVAAALFSHSGSILLAMPLLVVMFAGVSSFFAIGTATIQTLSPPELRGRVTAIGLMLIGLWPVGAAISGILAGLWGAPDAALTGALLATVVLGSVALAFPQLRTIGQD